MVCRATLEYFTCLPLGFITKSCSSQFAKASSDSQNVISPLFFKFLLYSLQFLTLYLPWRNFFISLDFNILYSSRLPSIILKIYCFLFMQQSYLQAHLQALL